MKKYHTDPLEQMEINHLIYEANRDYKNAIIQTITCAVVLIIYVGGQFLLNQQSAIYKFLYVDLDKNMFTSIWFMLLYHAFLSIYIYKRFHKKILNIRELQMRLSSKK